MVPLIVMVGADKGGVGKTTMSRVLIDYFNIRGIPFSAYDMEYPAGGLKRFVKAAQVIDLERVQDQMRVFDVLSGIMLIDVRAGTLSRTIRLLDRAHLLDDVKSGLVNLALLHVLGPTIQSLGEVTEAADAIGGGSKHFIVKNYISETTGFFEWDVGSRYTALFEKMGSVTITAPHLEDIACEQMDKLAASFVDFASDSHQSRILRGYVRSWLDAIWRDFKKVGLDKMAIAAVSAT